jgi:hypothetical protein
MNYTEIIIFPDFNRKKGYAVRALEASPTLRVQILSGIDEA